MSVPLYTLIYIVRNSGLRWYSALLEGGGREKGGHRGEEGERIKENIGRISIWREQRFTQGEQGHARGQHHGIGPWKVRTARIRSYRKRQGHGRRQILAGSA